MKYVITGGAGFLGSHIAEALHKDHEVIIIDNFSNGKKENIKGLNVKIFDIGVEDDLGDILKGTDTVFHLAADIAVNASFSDPKKTFKYNILGMINLLESMRKNDVKKIVFSSSSAVYGEAQYKPIDENHPIVCDSPYAISKYTGEQFLRVYGLNYGIKSVALRYFNLFGPRQSTDSEYGGVVAVFISRLLKNEPLVIYGTGEQSRDFIYVKDVARANIAAAKFLDNYSGNMPEVFNIGPEKEIKINDLAKMMGGEGVKIIHEPERKGESIFSLSDCKKARQLLGFSAESPEKYLATWRQWWGK